MAGLRFQSGLLINDITFHAFNFENIELLTSWVLFLFILLMHVQVENALILMHSINFHFIIISY